MTEEKFSGEAKSAEKCEFCVEKHGFSAPDNAAQGEKCPDFGTDCGCFKTTERSCDEKKRLINRLSRIEGQIRGIQGMIERDAYCNDILIQSAAVNAAFNAFNRDLIAHHIKNCVVRDLKNGDESVVDELVETLKKLLK